MKTPIDTNNLEKGPNTVGFPLINFGNNQIANTNASKEQILKYSSAPNKLALWEFDVEYSKTYYSAEFIQMFGYTREEFEAFKSCCFITHAIHPDDINKAVDFLSKIKNNEIEEFQFTARMKHTNGNYVWVCYIGGASEFYDDGRPAIYSGIIKIVDEITVVEQEKEKYNYKMKLLRQKHERKEKEQQLLYSILDLFDEAYHIEHTLENISNKMSKTFGIYTNGSTMITYDGNEYPSDGYTEEECYLFSSFETFSGKKGSLIFHYDLNLMKSNDPSRLDEVSSFIKVLIGSLKTWLNKKETEIEFRNMFVKLESKVEDKTNELKKANQKLIDKSKDINDSINYANRIQVAMLPEYEEIDNAFEEAFVFYKPKDVISGDFYWFHTEGDLIYYACADCTGHGVPGALMSMVGNQLLNQIIGEEKHTDPSKILKEMDHAILKLFRKSNVTFNLHDGMSISLCVIDKAKRSVSFAGAYNNAYVFRNDEIIVLEADRHAIGGDDSLEGNTYTNTLVGYEHGDRLYMFTDGLPDQFGGPKGKKLMRKNVLEIISNIKHMPMSQQYEYVKNHFAEWKSDSFQVDDVTLLGVKL
jgi:PAS domain S-box-containing protein